LRSPLSRSQTPTASRKSRRFFQVWLLVGLPFRADHSAYFGALATLTGALAIYDLWRKTRRKPVPPSQRGPFIGTQQPQA